MEDDSMEIDPIDREISEEVEQLMAIVKGMQVDGDTTDEQLVAFTHEQRAYFIYWTSLTTDTGLTPVEEVLKLPQKEVLDRMKQWRNNQKPTDLDITMEDSSIEGEVNEEISKSKENASQHKSRLATEAKEVTPIKISARHDSRPHDSRNNPAPMNEETSNATKNSNNEIAAPFKMKI